MKTYPIAFVLLALVVVPAAAQQHDATVTVTLSNIYGVTQTGQADPSATPACYHKYKGLLGEKVTTSYMINTQTLFMSAKSTLLGETVRLTPMGIQGTFAFMSDGVPAGLKAKGIIRVIFEIDTQFKVPKSSLLATLNETNNCVINNAFD